MSKIIATAVKTGQSITWSEPFAAPRTDVVTKVEKHRLGFMQVTIEGGKVLSLKATQKVEVA